MVFEKAAMASMSQRTGGHQHFELPVRTKHRVLGATSVNYGSRFRV